ncbi:hypothetical protein H6G76_34855 [Nostoc sp. FACHB-152]|uniref:hypothetical protein n=1 Tax=unclassified Nostoc TaxID=2593658 RepID=UPI0016850930|nr:MULTISPECIES: hypothetical protein [unclassified Nostoc]MBD2452194.1 hypothetical protein [Nostoc sp. FACHB-152]MBD2473229.1 hypothetical protein [Nostoc sp. FACHB-145]
MCKLRVAGWCQIAEIIEPSKIIALPPDIGYWIDTSRVGIKSCAKIRFTSKLLEKPLLRENLKQDPVLKNLIVIRSSECYHFTESEVLDMRKLISIHLLLE